MEKALWYLLVGTRGGQSRAQLIRAIEERPRNANQLSEVVDLLGLEPHLRFLSLGICFLTHFRLSSL